MRKIIKFIHALRRLTTEATPVLTELESALIRLGVES